MYQIDRISTPFRVLRYGTGAPEFTLHSAPDRLFSFSDGIVSAHQNLPAKGAAS
jgi:hypothetical protein